jgi:hypothetical protein
VIKALRIVGVAREKRRSMVGAVENAELRALYWEEVSYDGITMSA